MDRILREERKYILDLCKAIQKSGCNVLLVQKSILRDAVNDLSLHFLAKMKILVVKDIERDEIEFISRTLGCQPVAHVDSFTPDKLGSAELVEESHAGGDNKVCCVCTRHGVCRFDWTAEMKMAAVGCIQVIKITGPAHPGRTVSVLVRSTSSLMLDEVDRSLHDALCVVRALVKKRFMIVGGGAPEMELSLQLSRWAKELTGNLGHCVRAYAEVSPCPRLCDHSVVVYRASCDPPHRLLKLFRTRWPRMLGCTRLPS
jgi:T-complex protein 1 subunit delta